ncbi:MAG: glycosyltransferase family 2 protein [Bacteroidales bacterium]
MEISAGGYTFNPMKPVSIVILNWNGLSFLKRFIPILESCTPKDLGEIVVADNGSKDDSLVWLEQEHPDIRLINLGKNHGYAGGYNLALEQIDSPFAVLLNSDVEVTPGWLEPLVNLMENPEVGAAMPKIRSHANRQRFEYAGAAGGWIDRYGFPFCRGRVFNKIETDNRQYDDRSQIFWASGACMMVRIEAFRQAGAFDASFFAHMEEIDLCWRMHAMGYTIWVEPESIVYHVGGGTLPNESPRKIYLNFRNNLVLLRKNLPSHRKRRVLFSRMIFDGIAAIKFLLEGKPRFFAAIFKAHCDFYRQPVNKSGPPDSAGANAPHQFPGWYNRSIVLDFFILGKRQFTDLNHR